MTLERFTEQEIRDAADALTRQLTREQIQTQVDYYRSLDSPTATELDDLYVHEFAARIAV
jgi:hypothetical protein